MMRKGKVAPINYVYVQRKDGYLLHGISPGGSTAVCSRITAGRESDHHG